MLFYKVNGKKYLHILVFLCVCICVCNITILLRLYDDAEKNVEGYALILQECCRVVNRLGGAKLKKKRKGNKRKKGDKVEEKKAKKDYTKIVSIDDIIIYKHCYKLVHKCGHEKNLR